MVALESFFFLRREHYYLSVSVSIPVSALLLNPNRCLMRLFFFSLTLTLAIGFLSFSLLFFSSLVVWGCYFSVSLFLNLSPVFFLCRCDRRDHASPALYLKAEMKLTSMFALSLSLCIMIFLGFQMLGLQVSGFHLSM